MTTLREFLATRRTEISTRIAELRAELQEIEAIASALTGRNATRAPARVGRAARGGRTDLTLGELIVDVLRAQPEGADKRTIIRLIREKHGVNVAVNSLTTQLSRLKAGRILSRDGMIWKVEAERVARALGG